MKKVVSIALYFLCKPTAFLIYLLTKFGTILPDKLYLKWKFWLIMHKKLNLKNPKTFNEKLQWLKLYNRVPYYTSLVDKLKVKEIVSKKIGSEHVIPTLGVWDNFEDIDFASLPNQFVLKCNHDSGHVIICKDKGKFNKQFAKEELTKCLNNNFYYPGREWPYKDVERHIFAEKYMEESNGELVDYKIFSFDGQPQIIEVDYDRFTNHKRNLYDTDWKRLEITIGYPTNPNREFERPVVLEDMLEYSKILSYGIPFLRTDFYIIGDRVYFGELTFFHGSGFEKILPEFYDYSLGDLIKLEKLKKCV